MLPKPFNLEVYAENVKKLILAGWMPCGEFGEMLFEFEGKVYDLSAANLDMLDQIKNKGTFLAQGWELLERGKHFYIIATKYAKGTARTDEDGYIIN